MCTFDFYESTPNRRPFTSKRKHEPQLTTRDLRKKGDLKSKLYAPNNPACETSTFEKQQLFWTALPAFSSRYCRCQINWVLRKSGHVMSFNSRFFEMVHTISAFLSRFSSVFPQAKIWNFRLISKKFAHHNNVLALFPSGGSVITYQKAQIIETSWYDVVYNSLNKAVDFFVGLLWDFPKDRCRSSYGTPKPS